MYRFAEIESETAQNYQLQKPKKIGLLVRSLGKGATFSEETSLDFRRQAFLGERYLEEIWRT